MILLDSNIIIYSAQPAYAYLRPLVMNPDNAVSAFTTLEVLGFHRLLQIDQIYFQSVFALLNVKDISPIILSKAIELRQIRKISSGDALIAATALHFGVDLYTHNLMDFTWISGLNVVDPI
jgi:toxin FitB